MTDSYEKLLTAAIDHVEGLRRRGVRYLSVAPETIQALKGAPPARPLRTTPAPAAARPATPVPAARVEKPAPQVPSVQAAPIAKPAATAPMSAPQFTKESSANKPADKAAAFLELRNRVLSCVKCDHLVASRTNIVFGTGDLNAQLMFVGEAPGADEDVAGEPFVGKAGQLLTKIIETMGLSRERVFIANVLKCRPDMPPGSSGNRKPTGEEMKVCLPWLLEQIDLVQPRVLVALGATASEGLLGAPVAVTQARGKWRTFRNIPLMITFHPSYLLRNQSLQQKRLVWEDMLQVMEKLAMPISERQRRFFLSGQ